MTKVEPFDLHVYGPSPNPGFIRKARNATIEELIVAVKNCLRAHGLFSEVEFYRPTHLLKLSTEIPEYRRVFVIFDPGLNDGHYISVGVMLKDSKMFEELVTMKTFSGVNKALEIHNALAKMLCV